MLVDYGRASEELALTTTLRIVNPPIPEKLEQEGRVKQRVWGM